ncbi:MAG: D-alanine--D-alanine ligase [Salinivirgaceae bacterium]|jgi:D-alanine-D-alanine ligase
MKTIAIVCGGYSKEEVISLRSAEQIAQVIDKKIYETFTVLINREKWVAKIPGKDISIDKDDFSFIMNGRKVTFDAIFMAIHGSPGEDGRLQAYFEMLEIPVTTCNVFASALTFNKFATKLFVKEYGILTADALMFRKKQPIDTKSISTRFGFPMFVKPNNGGSSFGVSKVKAASELLPAIEKAFEEDNEIIIEPFIKGGEYTCGVFKSATETMVFPVTEIVSKTEFFDFEAKYTKGMSEEITPARLTAEKSKECHELSSKIYDLLGCNGVVRIDYLKQDEEFYFMEINTVPGMSAESIIPQQAKAYGLSVTEFYSKLIDDAIARG